MAVYELIRPDSMELAQRGIDCLMAGPETAGRAESHELRRRSHLFHEYCLENKLDLKCQRVAMAQGRAVGTCLWVPNKGKTALFYIPDLHQYPDAVGAVELCIRQALEDAAAAGMTLAQCLLETDNLSAIEAYHAAGFLDLATLDYMERGRPFFMPKPVLGQDIEFFTYTPQREELFHQAITASYINTLDCPALSGLRRIEDIIAGHQAVGQFDPSLWLLAMREGGPVGVLLMSHHLARNCLEIVYLGIAPEARGKGLGTAFMHMALKTMIERGAAVSTLAVDENNAPALALYRRLHYRKNSERRALYKPLQSAKI